MQTRDFGGFFAAKGQRKVVRIIIYAMFVFRFLQIIVVDSDCCVFDYVDYENYYPKNKKEVPKGNNQKAESGKGMQ